MKRLNRAVLLLSSLGVVLMQCYATPARAVATVCVSGVLALAGRTRKAVTLSRWRGAPLVVTMIYTSCRLRCPMTTSKLKKLDAGVHEARSASALRPGDARSGQRYVEPALDYKTSYPLAGGDLAPPARQRSTNQGTASPPRRSPLR